MAQYVMATLRQFGISRRDKLVSGDSPTRMLKFPNLIIAPALFKSAEADHYKRIKRKDESL